MSNVFCNYIFIYYRNNHLFNRETIQNIKKKKKHKLKKINKT